MIFFRGAQRVVEDFTEMVVEARRQIVVHHHHHHCTMTSNQPQHRQISFTHFIDYRQLAAYARERARKTKTRSLMNMTILMMDIGIMMITMVMMEKTQLKSAVEIDNQCQ